MKILAIATTGVLLAVPGQAAEKAGASEKSQMDAEKSRPEADKSRSGEARSGTVIEILSKSKLISGRAAPGAPDPGVAKGESLLVGFDAKNAPGVWDKSAGEVITAAGSVGGVRAAPAGDKSLYRSLGGGAESLFDFSKWSAGKPLASLSVYWGSIDSYNYLDLVNSQGKTVWTLAGSDLPQFNGDQRSPMTNQRVYLKFLPEADTQAARFRSKGAAFEFDNIGGSITGSVPEPGVWALLVIGFGFVGHVLRGRRQAMLS